MNHSEFAVSRFENRNGVTSWRVSGQLHGVRIRRNFTTREEAASERLVLEIKAAQAASGMRTAATTLVEAQLREAEAVFRQLEGQRQSLAFYVNFALANYREVERERALSDAVTEYLAAKQREQERDLISIGQVTSIKKELKVLQSHFPGSAVAELQTPQLTAYCERGKPSLKTYNNRRGILGTFFKFSFQKDWVAANPIEKVPHHRIAHRRGSARTLSAEQAQELMTFAEAYSGGALVPFFALCLFAGIRPCVRAGEIVKLRPEQVRLDTGVIHIEPEVSKVRMKRRVTIQPNLAAWLRAYPLERFLIVPPNMQHIRADIAKKFNLTHDVMRHTFISMFVAKFRSMGEAALQAGNSESIIRKHYLDLKTAEEAEQFFGILPKRATASRSERAPATISSALPIAI